MEEREIILRLLLPTDEQATKAIHLGMCSFHDLSARFEPGSPFDRPGLFSMCANMGGKAKFVEDVAHFIVVIPFIQAHALRVLLCRLRALNDDALDGRASQFHVMAVRSLDLETNRMNQTMG